MGIRGKLFQVFKSFVVGRRQQVRVGDSLSKEILATSGEPQGSFLSPLLFLIFINDLPDLCNVVYPLLFADDVKFLRVGLEPKAIQNDLNNIFYWFNNNFIKRAAFQHGKMCTHFNTKQKQRIVFL